MFLWVSFFSFITIYCNFSIQLRSAIPVSSSVKMGNVLTQGCAVMDVSTAETNQMNTIVVSIGFFGISGYVIDVLDLSHVV